MGYDVNHQARHGAAKGNEMYAVIDGVFCDVESAFRIGESIVVDAGYGIMEVQELYVVINERRRKVEVEELEDLPDSYMQAKSRSIRVSNTL